MSSNDPYSVLGLSASGATLAAAKVAYSRKLKETRPDDDPQGFMELREAYTYVRNQLKWAVDHPEDHIADSTTDDEPENAKQEEEIEYWYDEELEYNFNSSPSGKLIEKTIRWTMQEKGKNPENFFDEMENSENFRDPNIRKLYLNFLIERIYYDAGGDDYYDDEELLEDIKFQRPEWLSDGAILAIHTRFSLLDRLPESGWEARQLNCLKSLFEPFLVANGDLERRSEFFDQQEFVAKEMERRNSDDFGSYYCKKDRKWIDMSPVGTAMRDIEALSNTIWESSNKEKWREILSRDELQVIDQFQQLDGRLKQFICDSTGLGEEEEPNLPYWLGKDVVLLLDATFGWMHQSAKNIWEQDQHRWLYLVVETYSISFDESALHCSEQDIKKIINDLLGYEELPFILRLPVLLGGYLSFRVIQAILGY